MQTEFLTRLHSDARILDAGGWFIPLAQATHVADLMPYETRGGKLELQPLPGERFSRDTWSQVNFLDPHFRLPYPDGYFDYSTCGHTVEDLENPVPLLSELLRVSRAGYIETPSRLAEQTRGIRDRMTSTQGHPHHHWIAESEGNRLLLSAKKTTVQGPASRHVVPLRTYETLVARQAGSPIQCFFWENDFEVVTLPEAEVVRCAKLLVDSCSISLADRILDPVLRNLRRLKYGQYRSTARQAEDWWDQMLTLSRTYSKIPLQ